MDNLRGFEPFGSDLDADLPAYALFEDEDAAIEPPPIISGDDRRMQVRALNFWTSQLHDKNFPSIEELEPSAIEDFRDYSVLLDFTSGIENPSIDYLGDKLRAECGLSADVTYLDEVPRHSLLSRITEHYRQIIANHAPIGFEAEFVNDRGNVLMYRGILLPYSTDDDTIDFIYGVINWKETAPADISEPLQIEVEHARAALPPRQEHVPLWADGPIAGQPDDAAPCDDVQSDEPYPLQTIAPDENASLADWLDTARQCAEQAHDADLRTRDALYQAIGQAYDFALIAANHPADYAELLHDAGLKTQERAPFTPIVKLVFGAGYDKTRLTEFATALQFAQRNAVPMGTFATVLAGFDGGLKAIVAAERRAKKIAAGVDPTTAATDDPHARLRSARKRDLSEFAGAGDEFVLLVARRDADGSVAIVGSVQGDATFTEKALRKADV
jgi:hypothetical protein